MQELQIRGENLRNEIAQATQKLHLGDLSNELEQLRSQMTMPDFWNDSQRAQGISKQEASLAKRIEPWISLQKNADELLELIKLNDVTLEDEVDKQLSLAEEKLSGLKGDLKFNGPYDDHDVVLNIYAGAGGTDAQDWAQMLHRMYSRWAESRGLKTEIIDISEGEEAGIKSSTLKISGGSSLYGNLRSEHGVHRLVRLSPYNADHKRQTSFAKVDVLPLIEKPDELILDDGDLKIDVFRAGGHGGQSVNTTDSAVRITHLPTAISVAIQNERSQLQNKETALNILRSRLAQLQLEQHANNLAEIKGPNKSAEWGNQIRSYVLHPYKQVKDLRSGYESSNPQAVLDGDLDPLIDSFTDST